MLLRSSTWATILFLLVYFFSGGSSGAAPPSRPDPAVSENPAAALQGKTIVVDPGHGGSNGGAVGASGKTLEKTNVLFVALDLKKMLEQAGAKVIMTRDRDISPEFDGLDQLESRVAISNQSGADIFVSIHNDANLDRNIVGTTTYYSGSVESRRLAESIQNQLVKALGSHNHGVKSSPFYVLRNTRIPAVLVEVGFISNYWEEKRLADPAYRYKASQGIYNGLVNYFSTPGFSGR